MSVAPAGGEILRGMQVELQPLRIGRARAGGPEQAVPVAPADEERRARDAAVLQEARLEAERAGHEEGLRKGLADAALQIEAAVARAAAQAHAVLQEDRTKLAGLMASMTEAMDEAMRVAEDDMVALCFETICRIVADRALQPEAVRAQIQVLMSQLADQRGVVVRLHPQDVELVQAASDLRCVPDADVVLGGCIVQHAGGGIDARLESLLAACKETLLATRERLARPGGRP